MDLIITITRARVISEALAARGITFLSPPLVALFIIGLSLLIVIRAGSPFIISIRIYRNYLFSSFSACSRAQWTLGNTNWAKRNGGPLVGHLRQRQDYIILSRIRCLFIVSY